MATQKQHTSLGSSSGDEMKTKSHKTTLVPKLRFKEFDVEWEKEKLKIKILTGNAYKLSEYTSDGVLLVQGLNITPTNLKFDSYTYIEPSNSNSDVEIYKNDILLGLNRPITNGKLKICLYDRDDKAYLYQRAGKLVFKNYDHGFIYQILRTDFFLRKLGYELVGSDQPYIKSSLFNLIHFVIPTLPEQEKIASFLGSVDKKIALLQQKKKALELYKKGVMQQLFSQELRFKDPNGKNYPDWEMKRLNEITTPIKRTSNKLIENIMTISGANGFMHQKERFSQVIAADSLRKYTHILKDEFAYNRGNSKSYKYGCIYKMNDVEALIPYVYHSFKLNEGVPEFMEQLFRVKYLDKQLRRLISSSARMDGLLNIGAKDFFATKVLFPCLEEQQKIADFLSAIDLKIEACANQLQKTQTFKKGLLQQMFV